MTKSDIIAQLGEQHQHFATLLLQLPPAVFASSPAGKWTAAQHQQHLLQSIRPLLLALQLPKAVLRWVWGRANRPSRGYDELVARYHAKLQAGGRATGPFVPKPVSASRQQSLAAATARYIQRLCHLLQRYSEDELDSYVLPHPLLGKLTLREMMFFTIYHVQHHHRLVLAQLG